MKKQRKKTGGAIERHTMKVFDGTFSPYILKSISHPPSSDSTPRGMQFEQKKSHLTNNSLASTMFQKVTQAKRVEMGVFRVIFSPWWCSGNSLKNSNSPHITAEDSLSLLHTKKKIRTLKAILKGMISACISEKNRWDSGGFEVEFTD